MSEFEFSNASETKLKKGAGVASAPRQPKPNAELPREVTGEVAGEATVDVDKAEAPTKPKYSPDELAAIFDEVIFTGEYSEEVIIKGKLRVRVRTRTAEELENISLMVDGVAANLVATLAEKRAVLNLQYALIVYQGKDLRTMSTEDRSKFVRRLPGPIIGALLKALYEFDEKVVAACQEGEANF